ncbi:MAG TPA: hypothetical protein VMG35_15375 [Bryobacteraceae bacterium]|nr:hypothetical protein [Bryobacteraceae bacterium]
MPVRKSPLTIGFLLSVCAWFVSSLPAYGAAAQTAVLWRAPADIASRNLYYGPGGRKDVPRGTFTFVKEDLQGSNPKFVVRDQYGHKWKVKLGIEARPETVASRLVWAVGYSANEDYFVSNLHVQGMPAHLHRGRNLIGPDGWVRNVRLKREDEKKAGHWRWRHDPFTGTRELNGLKVVMALINNWDLKDVNNAIYQDGDAQIYMVSDLGASFGAAGRAWPRQKAKGNLEVYERSRFIRKVTPLDVDFEAPARPSLIYVVNPKEYFSRLRLESIGRNIPREDARWIGDWLARLSPKQILDAFRAADYSPREAAAFAQVIERRIAVLTDL